MSKRTDSNGYTLLFAIAMVLIVGALLAFTASSLRPMIDANKRIEKQQNILYAMGVNENDESSAVFVSKDKVAGEFSKYIKKQIVIEGAKVTEDANAYLIDVKKQQTAAKAGKVRKLPVFIGEKDGKTFYITPIRGKGLWDAIWAYVALDKNMVVQGAFFDHKGETPGLGANIKQRYFMDDFIGEDLMNNGSFKGIGVSKSNNDPKNEDKNDNEVDAIAGATITGDGVAAMIKSELGLYVPYFKTLK
ncbi:Na(+)-translocating NADH-quinone reductase subunit C [Tenacibaculum finnmarkense]|uniref:Na(+)-translocating NADH-quinone reductase subunit C n=1 Tax=Tenacibaculum finnmarkense genomovar finnmarkense TaxID=1458503 RepID=A0AAP1WF90_9FLAO|nr:Na(+)-translocating NADH-quinone reductase subunit C [Tenacibaculum finnmarkense]MBE7651592.1 Na(+)-translocating NADH-quinone reductase subunit C [Tenacibaculum finnmarkense genomovar finnmarkense]MBE7659791.1 Na(+)-translocating NADH-quinone reductase subunit C [Tenacibaculum finnmarkense genomovar finnmarkense]MBE7694059.1 Na(+)-translocating NADH-quinone reductase subunit C [Tenacibaculum finnmarkense genomovar finnmarkense]MCD8426569.1 Na(+)-translocating NADH-quinone reductase subunit 